MANLPKIIEYRSEFEICYVNNQIYLIGGLNQTNQSSNDIFILELKNHQWYKYKQLLHFRNSHRVVCLPDGIYIFGGMNNGQIINTAEKLTFDGQVEEI